MGTWRLTAVRNIHLANSISPYCSPFFSGAPGTVLYEYCTGSVGSTRKAKRQRYVGSTKTMWCCSQSKVANSVEVELASTTEGPKVASSVDFDFAPAMEEPVIQPMVKIDLARYTQPWALFAALETGHVRLLKMSWLISHSKANRILTRRQELPQEAFVSVTELRHMYGQGNRDGVLPIIAISYCWLGPNHPDPDGEQLRIIASKLEGERDKYQQMFPEMGVFLDWASLYQKDSDGQRTLAEAKGFKYALEETMDLWFAHQGTVVYMLTNLPEGSTRPGYAESGWPTYERCSAEQIKKVYLHDAKWKLVLDLGVDVAERGRCWPTSPDDFDASIETKTFTNGADKQAVKELYRRMSVSQLGGIHELDFTRIARPTEDDARRLGRCLNLCKNLKVLDLHGVGMAAETCKAMFSTISSEARFQKLILSRNDLGAEGAKHISEALKFNSTLLNVNLERSSIGEEGARHISEALKLNVTLQSINLVGNRLGPVGAKYMSEGLKENSALTDVDLSVNSIGASGAKHISEALKFNSTLLNVNLERSSIGEEGARHISEALKLNVTLQSINLTYNQLGPEGVKHIAAALNINQTLQRLHLNVNDLDEVTKMRLKEVADDRVII